MGTLQRKTHVSEPPTSGAVFVPAKKVAVELLSRYAAYGAKGRDTTDMIPCHQLVSGDFYADVGAANTAFAASANALKAARIGTSGSYQLAVSNGSAYVITPGIAAYQNSGVVQTGYTDTAILSYYTIGTAAPDSALTSQLIGPITLSGGIARSISATFPDIGWYSSAGTFTKSLSGIVTFSVSDPLPVIKCQTGAYKYTARIKTASGYKFLRDPANSAVTTNGGVQLPGSWVTTGGGVSVVQLDFSQLALGMHTIEVFNSPDAIVTTVAIRSGSGHYYASPKTKKLGLRSAMLSDSMASTINDPSTANAGMHVCYSHHLRYIFGIEDNFVISESGSGFSSAGAGRKHLDKLKYLAQLGPYSDLDVLWLPMSVNDGDPVTIAAEMKAALPYASETWPNALIIVPGSTAGNSLASQALQVAACNAGRQVVSQLALPNVVYARTMDRPVQPITGAGTFGGVQDGGTSDYYFNTGDGTHFSVYGHQLWARDVVAPSVIDALTAYVGT